MIGSWREMAMHGGRTVAKRLRIGVTVAALASLTGTTACELDRATSPEMRDEQWSFLGLGGRMLLDLEESNGILYAATDSGVYRKSLLETGDWVPAGLAGRHVYAVLPAGGDTLLAAAAVDHEAGRLVSIHRSLDRGASWQPFQNGFGGADPLEVRSLARLTDGTILAGGQTAVVARSADGGRSWRVAWGDWDMIALGTHFLRIDPTRPGTVWSGGEFGAFMPFLLKSDDYGATWTEHFIDLGGDNAHYSVAVDPADGAVYTGTEGYVLKSRDGGATWDEVLAPATYPYFHGIEVGGLIPRRIYAAGAINTDAPQDLVVYTSENGGHTWRSVREPAGRKGGVYTTLLHAGDGAEHLYLGTSNGVVRFSRWP
jgi:hypothetical protein